MRKFFPKILFPILKDSHLKKYEQSIFCYIAITEVSM